jgi:urease accessory protein
VGALEAAFARAAHGLAEAPHFAAGWQTLADTLSALKPARESRAASARLGRRLLLLLNELEPRPHIAAALAAAQRGEADAHYSLAFGLAGGVLAIDAEATVLAYLQQSLTGLISACVRLLPLGQTDAARLLWALKPALLAAARSATLDPAAAYPPCFAPLVELGSMQHPGLTTRLFMS